MKTTSYKVADGLFLVSQGITKAAAPAKPVEVPTNHIVVIDCSGSMYGEIPKIREQIKKKLPKLVGEKDTLSIIWFSGRGEFGALIEGEPVSTLSDLNDVNKQIDRWLKPVGLTGFKEPLQEVDALIGRVSKKRPGSVFSLFFMSDGCDNQWSRPDILKAVEKAAGGLAAATFVEYGYYADRPLLTSMAEKAGGSLIFSEHFDKFTPIFEAAMAKRPTGAKRVEVNVGGDPIGGFVWTMAGGDLTTFAIDGGKAQIPEDAAEVFYLSPTPVKDSGDDVASISKTASAAGTATNPALSATYAAMSLFSVRMQPNVVFPLLKATGDVKFIEAFSTCFGKQKYSEFMDNAKAAAFDSKVRFERGYDPTKVPADDAFTVLDLLRLLQGDDSTRILLDHPEFKYNRISRGRLDASEFMNEEEQKKVAEITSKMASEKNAKKLKELQAELAALTAQKAEPLKFEAQDQPDGYSIANLTFNEDRPNISVLIQKKGGVDVSKRLPDAFKGKIPSPFPTFVYRNYAIVQDGLVNVKDLPVRVSRSLADKLGKLLPKEALPKRIAVSDAYAEGVINVGALPVINRQMVKSVSAKALFEKQFELEQARAAQKVYKAYRDERMEKKVSASFKLTYGDDGAEWLKENGFTDYSGFAPPKTVQAEAKDFYVGKALEVSLKGYSKMPSMNDFKKQASTGKFNACGLLMKPFVDEVEAELAKKPSDADFIKWIDEKAKKSVEKARGLIYDMAQIKFSVVVGQVWFSEFSSIDENTLSIEVPHPTDPKAKLKVDGTVTMKEVEIKI